MGLHEPQVIDESPFHTAIRLESKLRNMLKRRVGTAKVDDAWSEVVLPRIHRVCELWDPKQSALDAYVIRTMSAYAYKWVSTCSERVRERSTMSLPEDMSAPPPDEDLRAQLIDLKEVLAELSEFDRWIIRCVVLESYSYSDLAKSTGMSRPRIKALYEAAITRARDIGLTWLNEESTVQC